MQGGVLVTLKRAGCLVVIYLVPLCSRFSIDLPAYIYCVERGTFQWAHWWLGRIYVLHRLIHRSIVGTVARNTALETSLVILLLTLATIIRRWPQLGLKVHHILALIVTGGLFYHLIDRGSSYR
ncbi:hypothetical protein N7507_000522 [Penicillium longicatenatum]|nr:hypothetical protein N7507_000522 [Penicillium longicatenatum]